MANCLIDQGSTFSCTASSRDQGGIHPRVILINFEDWQNAVATYATASNEITDITLLTGIVGYSFAVDKSSNIIPQANLRAVDGGADGFDHMVDVRAFDVTQLSRENIAKIRFAKVVAIVPKLNGKSLLYGEKVGMRLSDFVETPADASTGGTIQFILKTPDNDPPEQSAPSVIASTYDIDDLLT